MSPPGVDAISTTGGIVTVALVFQSHTLLHGKCMVISNLLGGINTVQRSVALCKEV